MFQNVHHINVPTVMDGLRVVKVDLRQYDLSGDGWEGEVDAGVMMVAEDQGSYSDPSQLFPGGL